MSVQKISNAILGVGVDDTTIDLFESQYPVPTGVSYNSYVILDEKVAILDTVDNRATDARKRKGRGSVAVGRVFGELRQRMNTYFKDFLFLAAVGLILFDCL